MAILRLTLSNLETEILRLSGYAASADAPWTSSATLYQIINRYMQQLSIRAAEVMNAAGLPLGRQSLRFDMWRTQVAMTTTSGSSNADFPTDYDHYVSFWDNTNNRPVYTIEDVERFHPKIRLKPAGPPEFINIRGFVISGSTWVRRGILYPSTPASVTPSINLEYWRLPAIMPGSAPTTEYPDIDIKLQELAIYGPLVDLKIVSGPAYDRLVAKEKELLLELCHSAKAA